MAAFHQGVLVFHSGMTLWELLGKEVVVDVSDHIYGDEKVLKVDYNF